MLRYLGIFLIGFIGIQAFADPPPSPKNLWRNSNYYNHYVLYERKTNTWIETVDCKALWRFTKQSSDLNNLYLRDAGRKLTVKLSYDGMYLKYDNESAFKLYQRGTFDKRVRFFHQYNGQWSGTVSRGHACNWEELLAGSQAPNFRFKVYGENASSVFLFDASRNMRVKLNTGDMWLQEKGQANFSYFKNGYWSEN